MSKIVINNVELEIRLFDADCVEGYEKSLDEIQKKIRDKKNYEGLSVADTLRFQCRVIEAWFDKIFGEGTSAKIFPQDSDLEPRMDAFGQALKAVDEVGKTAPKAIMGKYLPQQKSNRKQRRYMQKHPNNQGKARRFTS